MRQHEPALRELIAGKLKRGKVEVRAAFEIAPRATACASRPPRMLQRLNALQDNVRAWLPDAKALSVADVVRMCATEGSAEVDWAEALARTGRQDAR